MTHQEIEELKALIQQQSAIIKQITSKPKGFWDSVFEEIKVMIAAVIRSKGTTLFGLIAAAGIVLKGWPNPDWELAASLLGLGAFSGSGTSKISNEQMDVATDIKIPQSPQPKPERILKPKNQPRPKRIDNEDDDDEIERG